MSTSPGPEEVWEVEVATLLAGLPPVEPPEGFIATAVDHPPLHAGRILVSLTAMALGALAAVVALGIGGDARAPALDDLAARHVAARATVFVDGGGGDAADRTVDLAGHDGVDPAEHLPAGFEPAASLPLDGIGQYVFHRGDDVVSVFVQRGKVDWSSLPDDGERRLLGHDEAWVDRRREVTIVQDGDDTVTIVGLPVEEVMATMAGLEGAARGEAGGPAVIDRVEEVVVGLARQLGLVG